MRILYLTHRLPYAPNRGDRIRAYHTVRHLAQRHQVDLVSLVHDDEEAARIGDLLPFVDSVTTARVRRAGNLVRGVLPLLRGRPLTHVLLDAPDLRSRISEIVARSRPDVVLAYCSGMARFALEPPLHQFPLVLDMVDVDSEKWAMLGREGITPKHWVYRREASRLRIFERDAARAAKTTLVVNDRERRTLAAIGVPTNVEVVPNGIALDEFRSPHAPSREPHVVFCGVMNYEPNETAAIWLAREVWPRVRAARPDARLFLVGANPARRLRQIGSDDPTVTVTGSVPQVLPFLWHASVAAAPLAVARGLQNKVLEAVAAGLPTVVTSAVLAGLPSEVLPACRQADSPSEFADEILRLLRLSPAERAAMMKEATLQPLDWSQQLASLDRILSAAAGRQRRAA